MRLPMTKEPMTVAAASPSFVYVLRSGGGDRFKVGRTRGSVEARRKQLATGNPEPLTVFDAIETEEDALCETYLHHKLREKRVAGGGHEFFELDADELANAIRDAREFLEEYVPRKREAERLATEESEERLLSPGGTEWELYRQLLETRAAEDYLAFERERVEVELKLAIGTAAGLEHIAAWKTQTRHATDCEALRLQEPEIYERFLRETRSRVFRVH